MPTPKCRAVISLASRRRSVSLVYITEPSQLKGIRVAFRLGGASDFSFRHALDRWGLVPEKDRAVVQVGGEAERELEF